MNNLKIIEAYKNGFSLKKVAEKFNCSATTVNKIVKKAGIIRGKGLLAEKNPAWKGDKVGYEAVHAWINKRIGLPKICIMCGTDKNIDLANISQKYKRDVSDWEYLCGRCHMLKDGRMERIKSILKERNKSGKDSIWSGRKHKKETIKKMQKSAKGRKRNLGGMFA